ncbi:MAG: hypothetical protein ACOH15_02845 [Acetobacterium sp.]
MTISERSVPISKDKISYVKAAVEQGYTFKEIGNNIEISAAAANKIVQ